MKATDEKKKRKKWPVVLAVVLVLGAFAYFFGDTQPTKSETKESVQAAVEALIPDAYKGESYSCDILTASDGSGYIVSLQIDVDTMDCTETIQSLEKAINDLGNSQITEIQISAVKDFQIVGTN